MTFHHAFRVRNNVLRERRYALLACLLIMFKVGVPQMTLRVTDVPQYFTPLLDSVFVAGNFNGWLPGDTAFQLQADGGGDLQITLNGTDGDTIEFKFTRGDWARVETSADGAFLPNRTAIFSNGSELTFSIADWDDTNGNHTISGTVIELDYNFYMPQYDRTRRIWIYLPPDYATSTEHYPVVYMHDGQNVFDQASSFAGEWDADGCMQSMISGGHTKAIVVGVANGEADRIAEYTPWAHDTYGGGDGERYAEFLVYTLKPYIDAHYRTLPDRENTVVGGSSLGGLISYYIALEYDSVFGKAFVFSPSFWYADSVHTFTNGFAKTQASKLYFTAGLYEDVDMVPDMEQIYAEMEAVGFTADEYFSVIRTDGAHSEWFWKRELDDALLWLFEDIVPTQVTSAFTLQTISYDPVMQHFAYTGSDSLAYKLFDLQGKLIQEGDAMPNVLSMQGKTPGTYILLYHRDGQYGFERALVW